MPRRSPDARPAAMRRLSSVPARSSSSAPRSSVTSRFTRWRSASSPSRMTTPRPSIGRSRTRAESVGATLVAMFSMGSPESSGRVARYRCALGGTGPSTVSLSLFQDGRDLALCGVERVLYGFRAGQGGLHRGPHRLGDLRVLHTQAERARMREQGLVDVDVPL